MKVHSIMANQQDSNVLSMKNIMNRKPVIFHTKPIQDKRTVSVLQNYFPNFTGKGKQIFDIAYSESELRDKTNPAAYTQIRLLSQDSDAYKNLSTGDKETLKHLVRAAEIIDTVYKKLDNHHNLEFEKYLNAEIEQGNVRAIMAKKLYDGQKGIFGDDVVRKPVALSKNVSNPPGKGFYPEDLSVEEFHQIIKQMLNDGEIEEVRNILNQRSVVVRDGEKLKAIDYTEYFKPEFWQAAKELDLAADTSTNQTFKNFLYLQAGALRTNDPYIDCAADKLWATMQDTPLEFTLGRECYSDKMTPTVTQNPELNDMLKRFGITAYAKDDLGVRVGIVDKAGSDYLINIRKYLPYLSTKMPYSDMYSQDLSGLKKGAAMVDIDMVIGSGIFGAYRGAITIASNLPNNDKLAIKTGGGRRMVYHKQYRDAKYEGVNMQRRLDAVLTPSQHKYFDPSAIHDWTTLHENVHSLGPKKGLEGLGTYKNTIEEFKADTGAFVMLDELRKKGFYSAKREAEIIISYLTGYVMKGPDYKAAHRICDMIIYNTLLKNGGIEIDDNGAMQINCKKVINLSREMLDDAIRIQLSGDAQTAKNYIDENAVWTDEMEQLSVKLKEADKRLNSYVVAPLAKSLLV